MIAPFLPLIVSLATYLFNLFVADKIKQKEYRLKILKAVDDYNAGALDSAKLRTEYERLKSKLRDDSKTGVNS